MPKPTKKQPTKGKPLFASTALVSDYLALPCLVGGYGFPSWTICCLLEGSPAKLWHVLVLAVFDRGRHCAVAPVSTASKLCFLDFHFFLHFFARFCSAWLQCNFARNKHVFLAVVKTLTAVTIFFSRWNHFLSPAKAAKDPSHVRRLLWMCCVVVRAELRQHPN